MKLQISILLSFISFGIFGQNVFHDRKFWATKPSIEIIKQKVSEGNDLLEMGPGYWDGPMMAIQADCDYEVIKYLFSQPKIKPNVVLHHNNNYLLWTAAKANLPVMELLLKLGSNPLLINSHEETLLMHVAMSGTTNPEVYEFCFRNGAKITDKNSEGKNIMLMAVSNLKDLHFLDYFLKKGISLNSTDDKGNGLFHYAVASANKENIKQLISMKISTAKNKAGENAFAFVGKGRGAKIDLDLLNYLKSLGLDPKNKFENGQNLAHSFAKLNTSLDKVLFLTENEIETNISDKEGNTPLILAAGNSDSETLKYWLKNNTINTQNNKGKSALSMAVANNSSEVVAFLIENGASTQILDSEGKNLYYQLISTYRGGRSSSIKRAESILNLLNTSGLKMLKNGELLHTALDKNDTELLSLLIKMGEPINAKDKEGNSLLHYAAMKSKNPDLLQFLVKNGADIKMKTELEETAFDLVKENEVLKNQINKLDFLK